MIRFVFHRIRWLTGSFLGLIGTALLITPYLFGVILPGVPAGVLEAWGVAVLAASVTLVISAVLNPARGLTLGVWLLVLFTVSGFVAVMGFSVPAWVQPAVFAFLAVWLAGLAWLGFRVPHFSPTSLRSRLALVLAIAASMPLIVTIALISNQEERTVEAESLSQQQSQAVAVAEAVSNYVNLHRAALKALANQPGLLEMTPDMQRKELQIFASAYPDTVSFETFDRNGTPLARSDDQALVTATGYPVFEQAKQTKQASMDILVSPVIRRPVFGFGEPILKNGRFMGLVSSALETTQVADFITRQSHDYPGTFYLVDDKGHIVAHPDPSLDPALKEEFTNVSSVPVVAGFLKDGKDSGTLIYQTSTGENIAAYARVPRLGWGVVMERQDSNVLAGVRSGRMMALAAIIICMPLVILAGLMLAHWQTAPLAALSKAASRMGEEDTLAPLPHSGITEVDRLAYVFGEMRERLALRRAQREQAQTALRQANEELEARVAERTAELELSNQVLETTNRRMETVLRSLPVGVWITDRSGAIVEKNQIADQIWGGSAPIPENGKNVAVYRAWWADSGKEVQEDERALVRAIQYGETSLGEVVDIQRFDGSRGTILNSAAPFYDAQGKLSGAIVIYQDITQQRQLEQQARQRSEELSGIFAAMNELLIVIDKQELVTQANPAAIQAFGFDPTGMGVVEMDRRIQLRDGNDQPVPSRKLPGMQALNGKHVSGMRLRLTARDGGEIDTLASTAPLLENGAPTGGVVVFHDVTEQVQMERALRVSEQKFRSFVEQSSEGILLVGEDGAILEWNRAEEQITGMSREEAIGKPLWEVQYRLGFEERTEEGDFEKFKAMIQDLLVDGQASWTNDITERDIHRPDGSLRTIQLLAFPIQTPNGWMAGMVSRDITEQRQSQAALRASEREFRGMFELAAIGKAEVDPTSMKFLRVNQKLCDITGYSEADLFQMAFEELTHPEDRHVDLVNIQKVMRGEAHEWNSEQRYLRKDGRIIWVEVNGTVVRDEKDKPLYTIATIQEITTRKQSEEAIRIYAEQLEQMNRELQEFAFISSHDLQEPLRKIQAFGERLKARYASQIDDDGRDFIERMQNAATRMQAMIEELLEYSRVTSRGKPFEAVDLNQVIREVLDDLVEAIARTGGQVKYEALPIVEADPMQMYQLFQNLIGNALKFHKPGEAPVVRVWSETGGVGKTAIQVRDNGIGFEMHNLDRIFQPFQRLHGRSEYEGNGIGLALCRKIAERHRGSITARSEPGEGATFIVVLPVQK